MNTSFVKDAGTMFPCHDSRTTSYFISVSLRLSDKEEEEEDAHIDTSKSCCIGGAV